ncbi:GNAT family N-acetyltransferase [Geomicrobium sediminis]|uniref:RimJ/RimL family protein N-acetyltransferase n=1 Tax=Geomicrobium sediminis TaxID=1347788 RepID=A0ABS2PA22_9BACL|nr:GNAT family protein [Geomicrobium sediminis]MBM7632254.1 RimJ/RimL family protein N-acetyltransferase [Geomicrobium sediminis]
MSKVQDAAILLRKPNHTDLENLYFWKYEEDKQDAKKWNGPYIEEPYMSKDEFLNSFKGTENEEIPGLLAIIVNDEFIGTLNSYWVDKNTDWLEIGIVIYNPNFWNGGFGTEIFKLWVNYIFENTPLHRVGISTWSGNERMIIVAKKAGMIEEARIRQARTVNSKRYDAIKMGILREEWEQKRVQNT